MAALMPPVVVLIVCKVVLAGPPDQNADFTHWDNLQWAIENSKMVCRREEVEMTDPAADAGAKPQSFTPDACMHSAIMLIPAWDAAHASGSYRVWRVACPVPIHKDQSPASPIIGWTLPPCGHEDTVVCLVDSAI